MITVFAHASCSRVGGSSPGGFGIVILRPDGVYEMSGYEPETDKRRMELQGVVEALRVVPDTARLTLSLGSEYVSRALSQRWLARWESQGWKTAEDQWIDHVGLWRELAALLDRHERVSWLRVRRKGSGTQFDDIAQSLARSAAAGFTVPLRLLGSGDARVGRSSGLTSVTL